MADSSLVTIVIEDLQRAGNSHEEWCSDCLSLPTNTPVHQLWSELSTLGYEAPDSLDDVNGKEWSTDAKSRRLQPYEMVEVVAEKSLASKSCVYIGEPLAACANRHYNLDITIRQHGREEEPSGDFDDKLTGYSIGSCKDEDGFVLRVGQGGRLRIQFHRTLRMPDYDKLHQLPASLGTFPLHSVSADKDRLPERIVNEGGIFLPMFQREAMWMSFDDQGWYDEKFAIRVFVGRVNAVTGKTREESNHGTSADPVQDYVVVPGQQWLDGICVAPGVVRQFVTMPLGSGYTVEGQKTGKEKQGGLQIEIIPSYRPGLRFWHRDESPNANDEDYLSYWMT